MPWSSVEVSLLKAELAGALVDAVGRDVEGRDDRGVLEAVEAGLGDVAADRHRHAERRRPADPGVPVVERHVVVGGVVPPVVGHLELAPGVNGSDSVDITST